jgi:hypothetical protein
LTRRLRWAYIGASLGSATITRTLGKHRPQPFPLRMDTLMEHLTGLCAQANLTLILGHIDANIFPGWSPVDGPDRVNPL